MHKIRIFALLSCLLAGAAAAQVDTGEFPPCGLPAGAAAAAEADGEAPAAPPRVLPLTGLDPRLAALLARSVVGGTVEMAVAAAPLRASAPGTEAALAVVEISAASLTDAHPGGCLGVELALLAVAANGRVVASRHDGVAIDVPSGATLGAGGLRYLARLDLPPGEISLRALARVHRTGAFALVTTRFSLPAAAPQPAAARAGAWLEALAPGLDAAEVAALAAAGAVPQPLGVRVEAVAVPRETPAAKLFEAAREELEKTSTLVSRHLAALGRLASGQPREAAADLAALDLAALEADPEDGLDRLARAGERVLGSFHPGQRGALLPVALLYAERCRIHHAGRQGGLARLAAEAAERALERFALSPVPLEEGRLAAAALDGLAAEDLRHGDPSRAILLLARAAGLEPDRAARWLALAVLYERDWRLADAARAAERALETEPGQREALLRSARIARLAGEPGRAAERLEPLLATPERDWILAVAAEERARLYFDAGRPDLAAPALERASELLPEEAPLAAALAFARFRSGDRPGAFAAAARAAETGRATRAAPRRRYGELPLASLLRSHATAEAAGLMRLDALARAVARIERER